MSARGPRKAPAKKAVAPAKDDPQTPFYDARADDGSFAKEADDTTAPEAVAEETASAGDSASTGSAGGVAPAVEAEGHCSECSSQEDLVTVGTGDAERRYCQKHKPLNA